MLNCLSMSIFSNDKTPSDSSLSDCGAKHVYLTKLIIIWKMYDCIPLRLFPAILSKRLFLGSSDSLDLFQTLLAISRDQSEVIIDWWRIIAYWCFGNISTDQSLFLWCLYDKTKKWIFCSINNVCHKGKNHCLSCELY